MADQPIPEIPLEQYSPADDDVTRAFIDGWNAARSGEVDFDMALHFWNRDQCGLRSADDLVVAAQENSRG